MALIFGWFVDVFSKRYIKSLELLHDCDEGDADSTAARHSVTSLRKNSDAAMHGTGSVDHNDKQKSS